MSFVVTVLEFVAVVVVLAAGVVRCVLSGV